MEIIKQFELNNDANSIIKLVENRYSRDGEKLIASNVYAGKEERLKLVTYYYPNLEARKPRTNQMQISAEYNK